MLNENVKERLLLVMPELARFCRPPRKAREFGLSSSQAGIVKYLAIHKTATMSELAHKFGISLPSVTELVNKLVSNNMVERIADESDRRIVRVKLTPSAGKFCSSIIDSYKSKLEERMGRLTSKEQETFMELLEKIVGGKS